MCLRGHIPKAFILEDWCVYVCRQCAENSNTEDSGGKEWQEKTKQEMQGKNAG